MCFFVLIIYKAVLARPDTHNDLSVSDDAFASEGEGCSLWYDEYSNVISTWFFFLQPSIAIATNLRGFV